MEKAEKSKFVSDLQNILAETSTVVVAEYAGLNVQQMQKLRRAMRASGGTVAVMKNRLVKIAIEGGPFENLAPFLKGPTLLAYSRDPVVAPKIAVNFAKEHDRFIILGGSFGGTCLNAGSVKALAEMPSIDELRGRLMGLLKAPATKLVQLLQTPATHIVRILSARRDQ